MFRHVHIWEYLSEFVGTVGVVIALVPTVAWFFPEHTAVSAIVPSIYTRLAIIGFVLGGAGWIFALTPAGRLSGAHLNPALSLGYLLLAKMRWPDFIGYVLAQFTGAATGAWIGVALVGARAHAAHDGALAPGPGLTLAQVWVGEILATFALTFLIYSSTSDRRLRRFTPAFATLAITILVTVDGLLSGAGMSPSRWFGPALVDARWGFWSAYLIGPLVGASAAAAVRRGCFARSAIPHTAKIVHDPRYRSIFLNDSIPSASRETP